MIGQQERQRIAEEEEVRVEARRKAEVWIEGRLALIGLGIIIIGSVAIWWLHGRQ
jgi:hypothetical protein